MALDSRKSFEAFCMLSKTHNRVSKLAVLGALAVCLMLAFSTFAQQAVAIVLRDYVIEDAVPSLNRTLRYSQDATILGQGVSAGSCLNDFLSYQYH